MGQWFSMYSSRFFQELQMFIETMSNVFPNGFCWFLTTEQSIESNETRDFFGKSSSVLKENIRWIVNRLNSIKENWRSLRVLHHNCDQWKKIFPESNRELRSIENVQNEFKIEIELTLCYCTKITKIVSHRIVATFRQMTWKSVTNTIIQIDFIIY